VEAADHAGARIETPNAAKPREGRGMNDVSKGRCLGLIGGLGVGATIHYYQLVKEHAVRGCVPNLLIIHADVTRVLKYVEAGHTGQLAEYLSQLLHRLRSLRQCPR
jgi:hypothetical protein